MALLPRHVVALCGHAGGGEGGKVHSLSWWKKSMLNPILIIDLYLASIRRMVTNKILRTLIILFWWQTP